MLPSAPSIVPGIVMLVALSVYFAAKVSGAYGGCDVLTGMGSFQCTWSATIYAFVGDKLLSGKIHLISSASSSSPVSLDCTA